MISLLNAACLAGMLLVILATVTPDLAAAQLDSAVVESQPVVTKLGTSASSLTYWVSEPDGWRVVTTIDTVIGQDGDAEKHAVVRFSSTLLPGQSQLISVPLGLGEHQQVLRISRIGDRIQVELVPGV